MQNKIMRYWWIALCAVLTLAGASAVMARHGARGHRHRFDDLTLTILNSPVKGAQGSAVAVRATVTNNSDHPIFLNQLSVTLNDTDQIACDTGPFQGNFSGALAPGASISSKTLFNVSIDAALATGTYNGTAAILGGTDADALDNEAQQDFQVNVVDKDTTPPTTTITGGPSDGGIACSSTVTFGFTGSDNLTSPDALTYQYSVDGGAWQNTSDNSATVSYDQEGPHTFAVAAIDESGNIDPNPPKRTFAVLLTPPTVDNIAATPRDVKATINWTSSRPATSLVEYGSTTAYGSSSNLDTNQVGSHAVTLTGLTPKTTYHYRVKSNDGCRDAISDDQTFTTTDILLPNLTVTTLKFSTPVRPLETITVAWQVLNSGQGDTSGTWVDTVYLSDSATLGSDAQILGKYDRPSDLDSFNSYDQSRQIQMPLKPAGTYYLIVKTDADNAVKESNEDDNTFAMPIEFLKVSNLIASPDQISLSLNPTVAAQGEIQMGNLSAGPLTNITAAIENPQDNITIQVTPPSSINSLALQKATYTVTAKDESILQSAPVIHFVSQEGEDTRVTLNITVIPRRPQLQPTPGSFMGGMTRGKQNTLEVQITNTGSVYATGLQVSIPQNDWMSLSSPVNIGNLAPGATAAVSLLLSSSQTLPLGAYTGAIAVNGGNTSLLIPYNIMNTSDAKGDLKVIAQDEYSFFADTKPNVAGAQAVLKDAQTGAIVAQGTTDDTGTWEQTKIPEGAYNLEVTADKHGKATVHVDILPGQEQVVKPFLPRMLVTYTWSVIPVDTQDQYVINLQATFETHVPAPVVTITPANLDVRTLQFDANGKAVVNYVVTNHGLIAADGATFDFDPNGDYTVTPAIKDLGSLPALTTRVVPVTIAKNSGSHGQAAGDCYITGHLVDFYVCGEKVFSNIPVFIATGNCGVATLPPPLILDPTTTQSPNPNPGTGTGTGTGTFSPYSSSPNLPVVNIPDLCDPCNQKRLKAILLCGISLIPGASCGVSIVTGVYGCYDSASSGGFSVGTVLDCSGSALGIFTGCAKDVGGKVIVFGYAVNVFLCYYDIVHACDGIHPQDDSLIEKLSKELDSLKTYIDAYTAILGDSKWMKGTLEEADIQAQWFAAFQKTVTADSDGGRKVSDAERSTLLATTLPSQITADDVNKLVDRWNRTFDYYSSGIFDDGDVPAGQSHDFIHKSELLQTWQAAQASASVASASGQQGIFDGVQTAVQNVYNDITTNDAGVCARVRVSLNQDVALTRTAFLATLELMNSPSNVNLDNIKVTLDVRDQNNQPAGTLFGIPAPVLSGFGAVDGTGSLAPGANGSVAWTITPTRDAAPMNNTTYYVGGTVTYMEGTNAVVIPLLPTPITVKPDPFLQFHYFWQRDVYSDDPFTPEIEPSEPFALGLLVVNKGYGTARNMTIASSQPQIVDNDKGLLIDFKLIGTQINGQAVSPSLLADFGDLAPQSTATATFFMTSTLSGTFKDFSATFKHVDDLGNPRTSLMDTVDIHELEHVVRIDYPSDDGKPDFLVNDIPDINNLPDTVWSSDGTTAPVTARPNGATDSLVSDTHLKVTLTIPDNPAGYVYIRADDPAQGKYQLLRVLRSDGREIRLGDNAWTTDRTVRLVGQAPQRQQRVYLFDKDTTGTYTLIYGQLAPAKVSPGGAKKLGNGLRAILDDVAVTATFSDSFYVESTDRSGGIKVVYATPQSSIIEGALANVTGTLRTDANGERYVEADAVDVHGTQTLDPLGLTTRGYFGGDFAYDPDTGGGQIGMTGGSGLTSVGLLTRALGRVTDVKGSDLSLQMDDGYGRSVKVKLPANIPFPAVGDWVGVTGIASMENSGGAYLPTLLTRRKQDLFTDVGSLAQTFVSPGNAFGVGQNLFALPGVPADPVPPHVLHNIDPGDGSSISGRLTRFDAPTQSSILYTPDSAKAFGNLLLGDGYLLQLDRAQPKLIQFDGYRVDFADRWLSVPKIGLTQLGSPLPYNVNWEDLLVTDGTRTISLRDGASEVPLWVNPTAQYFDPVSQTYLNLGLPEQMLDSTVLMPWFGYLVTSSRDRLALIVPLVSEKPLLTMLTPGFSVAGAFDTTVIATGSGFNGSSVVYWNGAPRPTQVVSPTSLKATFSADDLAAATVASITVANGGFGSQSNALTFTVLNPVPFLGNLASTSIKAGSPGFALGITGSGFVPSSVAGWNNIPHPTTYLSSTQISVIVSDADLSSPGTASIQVTNPAPGGGASNGLLFTITGQAQDVSDQIKVTRGGFRYNRATGRFAQTVTLTNITNNDITGPLSLVLDTLKSGITLYNKTGTTSAAIPAGSPYLNAALTNNTFAGGASVQVTLEFTDPSQATIQYTTRLLAGSGAR